MSDDSALRVLLAEARARGIAFRVRGAEIAVEAPELLRAEWANRVNPAVVWHYAVAKDDQAYVDSLAALRVTAVLVEKSLDLRRAIGQLERDKRQHGATIGIDLETAPIHSVRPAIAINKDGALAERQPKADDAAALDPNQARVALCQLYAGGDQVFIFRSTALQRLLHSHWLRRQSLVAHNASFEVKFLAASCRSYQPPPARVNRGTFHCSQQSAGLLLGYGYAPEPHSLAAVVKREFNITIPKDYATSDWAAPVLSPGQLAYAGSDAVLTRRIHIRHRDALRQHGRQMAYDLQRGCIPVIAMMELAGMGFSREQHTHVVKAWQTELEGVTTAFREAARREPPGKPAEIVAWLESVLSPERKARWPRTEKTRGLSTAGAHLKRLASVPAALPLLRLLALRKLISAFGFNLPAMVSPTTGRIHASVKVAFTKSGRLSCEKPNLQQLPSIKAPEFKTCIVPEPGNLLIGADWNQLEMRAAAWIARDPALTEVYVQGRDIHSETAAAIARVPRDQVDKAMRKRAKPLVFGATFGMKAPALVEYAFDSFGVEMSLEEAQRSLDRLAQAYPRLHRWKHENYLRCVQRGYVEIGCGRVVKAEWEAGKQLWFALCCNLPIQGISADAMMRALQLVHMRIRQAGLKARIIATVHDELLLEAPEREAQGVAALVEHAMIDAFTMTFPGAPTRNVVEARIGTTWAALKDD